MELRELARLVARTRSAQQAHHRRREPEALAAAKALEADVDAALRDTPPSPFADLVGRMRAAQRAYYRAPSCATPAKAKALEGRVDRSLRDVLDQPRLFADDDDAGNPAARIVRDLARDFELPEG